MSIIGKNPDFDRYFLDKLWTLGTVWFGGNLRSILKCKWRRRWFISVNPTLGLRLKCGLGCTRAKFVCSGDYFHFLPRRIFSLSMRLLGFQVQLRLSTSRTSPEKWPWTDTSRKTTQWTTAWQKSVYITLSQKAIFRHKNRENLSKTIFKVVTRVTFIGRPGWLTLYRPGWF